MGLISESSLRNAASEYQRRSTYPLSKSVDALLRDVRATTAQPFDVFLSHSISDAKLVLGVVALLQTQGLRVYVDWIVDHEMDRSKVTPATAERLRKRMRQSSSLIYAHSSAAASSKWMPWELGYFDGFKSAVAVLPIVRTEQTTYSGQEYLGLYPYIDGSAITLWVNRGSAPARLFRGTGFKKFQTWLKEQSTA